MSPFIKFLIVFVFIGGMFANYTLALIVFSLSLQFYWACRFYAAMAMVIVFPFVWIFHHLVTEPLEELAV